MNAAPAVVRDFFGRVVAKEDVAKPKYAPVKQSVVAFKFHEVRL